MSILEYFFNMTNRSFSLGILLKNTQKIIVEYMSKSAWICSQFLKNCSKISQLNYAIFGTMIWLQPQILQL